MAVRESKLTAVAGFQLIEEVAAQGTPVILVPHHLAFARRVSDTTLFLSEGQITEQAHGAEFFERPKSEICRRFLDKVLRI
jgi:ABC-type histidine transport system ATPase subunit